MKFGFLSDAHGNVEAFELALAVVTGCGAEQVYFLGDAVGYLPGAGVVDLIRERRIPAVRGNHEAMLLAGDIDADADQVYRLAETGAAMTAQQRAEIAAWPTKRRLQTAAGPLLMVHGSPADPTLGYVYPDTPLDSFEVAPGTIVLMGNTHRPFVRTCNGARFVNVGSCGLPRDAGRWGAACLFDDDTGELRVMRFDIASASAAAMERCPTVHPSVAEIYRRPDPDDLFGELHED